MRDMICPRCNSENIIKNGNTVYGKPKFMCKDCRRILLSGKTYKLPEEFFRHSYNFYRYPICAKNPMPSTEKEKSSVFFYLIQ
ncbi:MAG: hypothetical protein BWK80_44905 [Desulfobacteraceae bacterium IS3]|nr:MAG: hypothetical protein BWK80_44905 [Desulfobacteraceae bacterium IS3]